MAAFSSVARKPGQTLKPKAVPRKNAPRHAQKAAIGTVESLTPESLPHSPVLQPDSHDGPASATSLAHDFTLRSHEEDGDSPPTPPATAEGHSPSPVVADGAGAQQSMPTRAPLQSQHADQSTANISSAPSASESQTQTGMKRKAHAVENTPVPLQAATSPKDVNVTKPRLPKSSVRTRKRRKIAPQGAPSYLLSRPAEPSARATTETPFNQRGSSVAENRARASTDDLLQQATAQFGSVSKIAGSIENRIRNLRPRTGRRSGTTSYVEVEGEDDPAPRRRNQRSTRSSAIDDLASAVVDRAVGCSRKRRRSGSEASDPENYEIDVDTVTMSSLTKDSGLGKRSATGKELEENWAEISKRWKERPEENRKRAHDKKEEDKRARKERERHTTAHLEDGEELASPGPAIHSFGVRQVIVNGTIVADPDSRNVLFSSNVEERAVAEAGTSKDVRRIYDYVNSNRIGKHAGLRGSWSRWDDGSTELFYKGLRMFGTDFEMIASLFPNRTRKEIKDKYNKEEREEWDKVQDSLKNREPCAIEEYAEMVGREGAESFLQPEVLQAELDKQKERLEKEAEGRLREDNRLNDGEGADEPIQSIEVDAEGNEFVRETTEGPTVEQRPTRVQELADAVVEAATAPTKKTRRPRTRDTSRITKTKKGRQTLAGTEEVIGRVDEVER